MVYMPVPRVLGSGGGGNFAVGGDGEFGLSCGAVGGVGGSGHAVANEVVAFGEGAGFVGALGPAEAVSGLGVGGFKVLGGPGAVVGGIFLGVVNEAKLEGIHRKLFGKFVHGDFKNGGAGGFARGAHEGAHAEVCFDDLLGDGVVLAVVEHLGNAGGVLDKVFKGRRRA